MNTPSKKQSPPSPAPSGTVPATILVVDDHRDLRLVASLFLQKRGYRVLTANGGEHARRIASEQARIDLLLTDIEMPDMMGDALAEWFRVRWPGAAVVFMSGNPMHQRRLQPCYFVEKPFIHLDTLVKTIREALHDSRSAPQTASATA